MKQLIMMDEQEFRAQVQSIVLKEISRSSRITNKTTEKMIEDKIDGVIQNIPGFIQDKIDETLQANNEFEKILSPPGTMGPWQPGRAYNPWELHEDKKLMKSFKIFAKAMARKHERSLYAIACRIKRFYDEDEIFKALD